TAAHHPHPATRVHPGLSVDGRTPVAVMPAVGDPLAHVACKVVKTVCIGGETGHGRRAPETVVVAGECVVPAPAARRAVAAAGDVAHVRRRGAVAPGEAPLPARAQRVFELRFAGHVVTVPAAVGQPLRIRIGVARADMDHGHVLRRNAAVVGVAPVHAVAAHEVAAALVVHHGEAAPAGGGAIAGGGDEAAELGHGDFGARHGEAALEADVMPRPLAVAGTALAVGRTHGIGAVR